MSLCTKSHTVYCHNISNSWQMYIENNWNKLLCVTWHTVKNSFILQVLVTHFLTCTCHQLTKSSRYCTLDRLCIMKHNPPLQHYSILDMHVYTCQSHSLHVSCSCELFSTEKQPRQYNINFLLNRRNSRKYVFFCISISLSVWPHKILPIYWTIIAIIHRCISFL